jgi:hypothetical protein
MEKELGGRSCDGSAEWDGQHSSSNAAWRRRGGMKTEGAGGKKSKRKPPPMCLGTVWGEQTHFT